MGKIPTKTLIHNLILAAYELGRLCADERPDCELKTEQDQARQYLADVKSEVFKRIDVN